MSVSVPVIDYIDGSARRIYLLQGVDAFHWIEDVYREYVDRRANDDDFRKWSPLMVAKGNDSKGLGKYTPRYITLLNGCRVIPYDENIAIYVTGEAITDNPDVDPDPFDTSTRTNPLKLFITPPAAEIVKDVDSLAAIAHMSFNNEVWLDPVHGFSFASFTGDPILLGNGQYPVNSFEEAYQIATSKGLTRFRLSHANAFSTPLDIVNFNVRGDSAVSTSLQLDPSAVVDNCQITDLTITGTLDGGTIIERCVVNGINYFNGIINNSALTEQPIVLGGSSEALFFQCFSAVPGGNARPRIDFNHGPTPLAVRDWYGGLELVNKTNDVGEVSVDMSSGTLYIRSSCTAGEITVRGIGRLVDESGAGCNVISNGLLDPSRIATDVWSYLISAGYSAESVMQLIKNEVKGKAVIAPNDLHTTIYDTDGVTVSHEFDISADKRTRTPA